jgi:ubiquinone/menaquinone biosynthesis C-methylase UbiE
MMNYLKSQFGHPRGLVGRLVGRILAAENTERIGWALAQLDIQPGEQVLEIGYGPGIGIEMAAAHINGGTVTGVDVSAVMLDQARRRNREAIEAGKVELLMGSVESLPFEADHFDLVYTINSFHIWPDSAMALAEILRALKPGGRLVIIEQPPEKITAEVVMKARGMAIAGTLAEADFKDLHPTYTNLKRGWTAAVQGFKAPSA